MADRSALPAPSVDLILGDLRALDRLGLADIGRVLPELERVRAKLWLSVLTFNPTSPKVPTEPVPQLLTVKEVADRLRFSRGHVYELVRSGQLRGIKDSRTIRITREALAEWQAAHEADRLDGSRPGSGESLLHDESGAHPGSARLRADRTSGRRSRSPMKGRG